MFSSCSQKSFDRFTISFFFFKGIHECLHNEAPEVHCDILKLLRGFWLSNMAYIYGEY